MYWHTCFQHSSTASFQAPEATCLLHGAEAEQQGTVSLLVSCPPAWNPPTALRGQLRLSHQLPLKINCITTVHFIFLFSITLLFSSSFFPKSSLWQQIQLRICKEWDDDPRAEHVVLRTMSHTASVYTNCGAPTKKHQAPWLHPRNSYSVYELGKRMLCF